MKRSPPNTLSEEGARKLARIIREYWEKRGYIGPRIECSPLKDQDEKNLWCISSDMVNGLPVR